jgi:exosortase
MRAWSFTRIVPAILIAAAGFWLYAGTLRELLATWLSDGNYSHGIVVLPVAAAIVYSKRKILAETPVEPSGLGNVLLAIGLAVFAFSRWSDVTFLAGLSMVIVIAGLVWAFAGLRMLRELAFPIAFLVFMTPPPDFFVERVGAPLQRASCSYAAMLGGICGFDVQSQGVMLLANGLTFEVDLPCSGIRAINCLTAFSAVLAYMARTSFTGRAAIFLAAIPVAFAANVLRVFVVIAVANVDSLKPDVMRFHDASGPVVFLLALAVVMLVKRRFECTWRDDAVPI